MAPEPKSRSSCTRKRNLTKAKRLPVEPSFEPPFRLLDLPAEIRGQILGHLFEGVSVEVHAGHEYVCDEDRILVEWKDEAGKHIVNPGAILLVNKFVHDEARLIVLRDVVFKLIYTNLCFNEIEVRDTDADSVIDTAIEQMELMRDGDILSGIARHERIKHIADKVEIDYDLEEINVIVNESDSEEEDLAMIRNADDIPFGPF